MLANFASDVVVMATATQQTIARQRCVLTALAIERFRKRTGNIPQTLAELSPDFPQAGLSDPFSGRRLEYQPFVDKYRVYSIGRDRIDDEGKTDRSQDDVFESMTVGRDSTVP